MRPVVAKQRQDVRAERYNTLGRSEGNVVDQHLVHPALRDRCGVRHRSVAGQGGGDVGPLLVCAHRREHPFEKFALRAA